MVGFPVVISIEEKNNPNNTEPGWTKISEKVTVDDLQDLLGRPLAI